MSNENYQPRLVVDLPQHIHDALNRRLPWGVKSQIFRVLCEDLLEMLKTDADTTIGAILTRAMKLQDFKTFKPGG
jgi:hypothetical protein